MQLLHDRMPAILKPDEWPVWLGELEGDPQQLLRPAGDDTQLQAQCRTKNRTFLSTSLNFAGWPPVKIDNLDGVLTCNIPPASPTITVTRIESASTPYEVTGSGFKGGSTVRIRVVSTPPNEIHFNNSAKVNGTLDAKVNPGCATNIVLHFSATDGRPNTHDLTGVLWSNTFNVTCP